MKTTITAMLGIDVPLFAFSHCRDVVVEVCKAGGMGVLGAAGFSPARLAEELRWIDGHVDGKPYGVDLLIPAKHKDVGDLKMDLAEAVPIDHRRFVTRLLDEAGVASLPQAEAQTLMRTAAREINMTPREADILVDVCLKHPIKLLVNGLGTPPAEAVRS
jgi:NAD(P)H-dependent flavin oxidoreductase YrpB (nitropropane dioxygenase family)